MAVSILRFPRGVIVPLFVESKVTDGFKKNQEIIQRIHRRNKQQVSDGG